MALSVKEAIDLANTAIVNVDDSHSIISLNQFGRIEAILDVNVELPETEKFTMVVKINDSLFANIGDSNTVYYLEPSPQGTSTMVEAKAGEVDESEFPLGYKHQYECPIRQNNWLATPAKFIFKHTNFIDVVKERIRQEFIQKARFDFAEDPEKPLDMQIQNAGFFA